MEELFPSGLVDELRGLQVGVMTPCTLVEQNVTTVCRIHDKKSTEHPDLLPRSFHIEYVDILLPYNTTITPGEHITHDGSTYCVIITGPRTPFRTARKVIAVEPAAAMRNEIVTLRSNLTNETAGALRVAIWPAGLDAQIRQDALTFDFAVGLPVDFAFTPSGTPARSGDTIICSWFPNGADISQPHFNANPADPMLVAYFRERA